jgi:hypothetical protein
LCDYIVQEVVDFVYREWVSVVSVVTLLAQLAVLPQKHPDLHFGTMDQRRNVTVVREGGLVEEVGGPRKAE